MSRMTLADALEAWDGKDMDCEAFQVIEQAAEEEAAFEEQERASFAGHRLH